MPDLRPEPDHQDAHERGEGRGLHRHRHERGDRRGGALVDVGRPHVKGDGRDLEGEGGDDEGQPGAQQRAGVGLGQEVQLRVSGGSVAECAAIDEQGTGDSPEHEVLEGGLGGLGVGAQVGSEGVGRDRHRLQRDEDEDQLVALSQQAHPGCREQQERVELPAFRVSRSQKRATGQRGEEQSGTDDGAGEAEENPSTTAGPTRQRASRGPPGSLEAAPQVNIEQGGDRRGDGGEHALITSSVASEEDLGQKEQHRSSCECDGRCNPAEI